MSTNTKMAEALRDAATLLETIGRLAGKPYYGRDDQGEPIQTYMGHNDEVRSYAKSRAGCAREALAAHDAEQAAKAVPADLRSAAERTRQDLGPTGSNYPDVRVLLAFAEQALAAPTPPAPEAQQAAGQEQDERDAFEAWATEYSTIPLKRDDDASLGFTGYTAMDQTMLWDAWQAAMAHAREAVESVPVPRIWGIANSRHAWIIAQAFDDYRAAVLRALGGK